MKKRSVFYLEAFLLTVSFIFVILVLSRMFVTSARQSLYARDLTNTVTISENIAEKAKYTADEDELYQLLKKEGNAEKGNGYITISYSEELKADPEGRYVVKIYTEEKDGIFHARIDTNIKGKEEILYSLDAYECVEEGKR